jgi:hypothetical protein
MNYTSTNSDPRIHPLSDPDSFYKHMRHAYLGWVCSYQRGGLTSGQVRYRVQSFIRALGTKKICPDANYKDWLMWMKLNHDNSFDHILG